MKGVSVPDAPRKRKRTDDLSICITDSQNNQNDQTNDNLSKELPLTRKL